MLYTLENVRAGLRVRDGKRVFYLSPGDRLSPAAQDWLRAEGVAVVDPKDAPKGYTTVYGGSFDGKPEELTHLQGNVLIAKTHPRIAFRGKIDTLEAELLLTQEAVKDRPTLVRALEEMLTQVRGLIRADVLGEPVKEQRLCGLTPQELREHSHFPQKYYGQPHFLPAYTDGAAILRLNRLRTAVRETELACCHAFTDTEGRMTRPDILTALNRLSSLCWILMIRQKAAERPADTNRSFNTDS